MHWCSFLSSLVVTLLCILSWAGPGGTRIYSHSSRPIINCEYLLTDRVRLLEAVHYVHKTLTTAEYKLILAHRDETSLQDLLQISLNPQDPRSFPFYTLKTSESEEGYKIRIENPAQNSVSEFSFEMPPLFGLHRLDFSIPRKFDDYLKSRRISVDTLGNEIEEEYGTPENRYVVYLKKDGVPTNLYLALEPEISPFIFMGIKLPCSNRSMEGFKPTAKVRNSDGWFCHYKLLDFEYARKRP